RYKYFVQCSRDPLYLHSFPTRRSSDLALKGVGETAIQTIVQDREKNGPFTDFYNFLVRVGRGAVNKRVTEALIRSGAFDSLHPRSEEHTSELQSRENLVCRLLLEKKKK